MRERERQSERAREREREREGGREKEGVLQRWSVVQGYRLPIDRLERPHAAGLLAGARSARELPPGAKAPAPDSIAQAASRTGAHLGPPIFQLKDFIYV